MLPNRIPNVELFISNIVKLLFVAIHSNVLLMDIHAQHFGNHNLYRIILIKKRIEQKYFKYFKIKLNSHTKYNVGSLYATKRFLKNSLRKIDKVTKFCHM